MRAKGKEKLKQQLANFVGTRLRRLPEFSDIYEAMESKEQIANLENRFQFMEDYWKRNEVAYREKGVRWTNHKICHEMFQNAFEGHSRMYIQMPGLMPEDTRFDTPEENETVLLQCSLLTLQMLDYDLMMFRAMSDGEDEDYRNAALNHYHPYLFSYVAEVNWEDYKKLQRLQEASEGREDSAPYVWLPCTFNPRNYVTGMNLSGYVVQSASDIEKIGADLYILENEKTPPAVKKSILNGYTMNSSWLKDDDSFILNLKKKLGDKPLATIDVYKIGNGNCVFAQGKDPDKSFFYDIGFHYRHRPNLVGTNKTHSYRNTMKRVYAKNPSFFILSHWDMDHIAGCFGAKKGFLDKEWFAPDCHDAGNDAQRLAKYLGLKGHLFLAERPSNSTVHARMIGQIDIIDSASQPLATYKLYMGEKERCDKSYPNCEGIVIEYTDVKKGKRVLMMGDVNYASFNSARLTNQEVEFADTQIDYLIAPHHGSQHTAYEKITDNGKMKKKTGTKAVICCTDEPKKNRPNPDHRKNLEDRFDEVLATESAVSPDYSISICI